MTELPMSEGQRRLILRLCGELGLDRAERHDLTQFIAVTDDPSNLTAEQAKRVIDALSGFWAVVTLLAQRPPHRKVKIQ